MRDLLWRLFGVPFSERERETVFKRMLDGRTGAAAVDFVRSDVTHNTEKSGALLAAQAIFLVVDLFALDQGWSKPLLTSALLVLLVCCVLALSNLRPTLSMYRRDIVRTTCASAAGWRSRRPCVVYRHSALNTMPPHTNVPV